MSLTSHTLLSSNPRISLHFTLTHFKKPNLSLQIPSKPFSNLPQFRILNTKSTKTHHCPIRAIELDGTVEKSNTIDEFNFDSFLSILEFLCLASSAVISIGFAVNSTISSSQKLVISWLGNRVFVWQFVLLVGAVTIGASIRRRQWRRICSHASKSGDSGVNLIERIEKLEEDIRSSATIVRVLSRQLEKLGIRFRVTRRSLKDPIAETAALAQKNSEATRALAVQEDILERELSEIQKVLLAMQEQQQKQLELILAIGKSGKLWDTKRRPTTQEPEAIEKRNSAEGAQQLPTPQIQALSGQKESLNDRA